MIGEVMMIFAVERKGEPMSDLIDRQAAIDAVGINTWAGQRLLKVPSAQPEIVRCRECKWWEKQEDSTLGYCNAAKHCYYSLNWEVQIYRRHRADFFCADGERRSENERPR